MPKQNALILTVCILLLLVSSFLIFESMKAPNIDSIASLPASADSQTLAAIHDIEINGMNVRYYILPEKNLDVIQRDYPDDAILRRGYSYDLIPNVNLCTIRVTEEYLASTDVASGILESLGRCYGEIALGFPTENPSADKDYVSRWVNEYRGSCDDASESFVLTIIDGSCENIPVFEAVSLAI